MADCEDGSAVSFEAEVDMLLLELKSSPSSALEALRNLLPQAKMQLRNNVHLLGRLLNDDRPEVVESAAELMELACSEEEAAEHRGGPRSFEWSGVALEYWELDDDYSSDLLFGNVLWACAAELAKLLIDASVRPSHASPGAAASVVPAVGGTSVMELGAGVGLPGLACQACGAVRVVLTDGEERLVESLRSRHGHLRGFASEMLNWVEEASEASALVDKEQFDVILGSDIMLSTNGGHTCIPHVVRRQLRRTAAARGLFISKVRYTKTHVTAAAAFQAQQMRVRAFRVHGSLTLTQVSVEKIHALPEDCHLLLVVDWNVEE